MFVVGCDGLVAGATRIIGSDAHMQVADDKRDVVMSIYNAEVSLY